MALPDLDARCSGWLRYLERKVAAPGDDWSRAGSPSGHWDNRSGAPTTNWYRFDAIGIATTAALASRSGTLAPDTAATMFDGLVDRLCGYHGFNEWVEQRGPDPKREDYPAAWNGLLIPSSEWGRYDSPGWASNGTQANGFEPNPIEAQGAIYYKGFLNYVLGLRTLVAERDPHELLHIVYDEELAWTYSHAELNAILVADFEEALEARADRLCCEIHKLWPL